GQSSAESWGAQISLPLAARDNDRRERFQRLFELGGITDDDDSRVIGQYVVARGCGHLVGSDCFDSGSDSLKKVRIEPQQSSAEDLVCKSSLGREEQREVSDDVVLGVLKLIGGDFFFPDPVQ